MLGGIARNKRKIDKKEMAWKAEKNILERKIALKEEKQQFKKKIKKSTSKMLIAFLFFNFTLIELFTGYITVKQLLISSQLGLAVDFTPLVTLIGAVVGEVMSFAIYSLKAAKENSAGGIVYEKYMKDTDNSVG